MLNKQSITVLSSEERTESPAPIDLFQDRSGTAFNVGGQEVTGNIVNMHLIIDVTAVSGLAEIQPSIMALDVESGKYYELLTKIAPINTVETVVLRVGDDMEPQTKLAERDFIPGFVRIGFEHMNNDPITYSVGLNLELIQ